MTKNGHSGNGHSRGGHVTETPDVSHIKNLDVTHEASDVSVSALLKFVLALTVMTVVVYVLMWGLFRFFSAQADKEPEPGPMALSKEERLPPEPRLQAAKGFGLKLRDGQWVNLELREPEAEYRTLREQWERQLNCKSEAAPETHSGAGQHSSSNTEHPTSATASQQPCVPIDVAMQKLLESSLPTRANANMGDTPMPTAASSGRMTEKMAK